MSLHKTIKSRNNLRKRLFNKQNGKCDCCGYSMSLDVENTKDLDRVTFEHIKLNSLRMLNERNEVVLTCYECNNVRMDGPYIRLINLAEVA